MSDLDHLLTECEARGIRFRPNANGTLKITGPRDALTPDLVATLRIHKAALLARLRPQPAPLDCRHQDVAETLTFDGYINRQCRQCGAWLRCRRADGTPGKQPAKPMTRVRSWRASQPVAGGLVCLWHPLAGTVDVAIHNGRSLRLDCATCGRFIAFTIWYGQPSRN